ncbi:Hypothetical Protein FCC1311_079852 [Hondaea fermentalgiana]|uniref:Uncharacterized protein n=1 Tax=Hondaea fermentalgiana TaxID=2315210 RepID=A0A2R5GLK7_9STRA|nr:Hypothetical Protein FCC1311_079852 [Hondaea fermentalgiana]|eukprot:GBG31760.1 Hypothetical Protein FCC1311_079852 [Hondaea fermentalgiana]
MADPKSREETLQECQRRTVYHGAANFAIGLLAGIPYTLVVFRDHATEWAPSVQESIEKSGLMALARKSTGTERAWKMAHLEGLLNGMSMLLVASIMPVLRSLSAKELRELTVTMMLTGYGNSVAAALCAQMSVRGLASGGSVANRVANAGFTVAVVTIVRALFLIMKGTR